MKFYSSSFYYSLLLRLSLWFILSSFFVYGVRKRSSFFFFFFVHGYLVFLTPCVERGIFPVGLSWHYFWFIQLWDFIPLVDSAADSMRPGMFFRVSFFNFQPFSCLLPAIYFSPREDARALMRDHHRLPCDVIKTLKIKGAFRDGASSGLLCWLLFSMWPPALLYLQAGGTAWALHVAPLSCASFPPAIPQPWIWIVVICLDISCVHPQVANMHFIEWKTPDFQITQGMILKYYVFLMLDIPTIRGADYTSKIYLHFVLFPSSPFSHSCLVHIISLLDFWTLFSSQIPEGSF